LLRIYDRRPTVVLADRTKLCCGMSGGIAYVLDEEGDFDYYCNMQMVELSLIEEMADNKELKSLIQKHHRYTGSPLAKKFSTIGTNT
jgi:glutamate synthase (NADPH/NADH) large chain